MLNDISKLTGSKGLSKSEQKGINGGAAALGRKCGGDGSFIIVDGKVVCCWVYGNTYIC